MPDPATAAVYQIPGRVVARITSGLGNQLFQYAFSRWLAPQWSMALSVNTTWFDYFQKYSPKREFRLGAMGLPFCGEHSRGPIRLVAGAACLHHRLSSPLRRLARIGGLDFLDEKKTNHLPDISHPENSRRDLLVNGYWQVARPAHSLAETMKGEILKTWRWSPGAEAVRQRVSSCLSVSVHVRRGDYAQWNAAILPEEYFRLASVLVRSELGASPTWFVFSEDREWCRAAFHAWPNVVFVDYTSENRDIEDMLLMAHCRGAITANSSYSWWGAMLGKSPGQLVVAPKYWWGRPDTAFPELYPADWRTIDLEYA